MRKVYLFASCMLFAGASIAQMPKASVKDASLEPVSEYEMSQMGAPAPVYLGGQRATVIWSEDWTGAVTASPNITTSNGAWTDVGTNQIWASDSDGPSGYYSSTIDPISSTSGAPYLMWDPGADNPGPCGACTDRNGEIISPTIDLSTYPNDTITMTIEHRHRYCCSTANMTMDVWVRNGTATWYNFDMVQGHTANDITVDPLVTRIPLCDIPGLTGGTWTNDVQIKFTWGGTGNSHYWWMIDDIQLVIPDDNELVMEEIYHGDFVNDWDYEIYPEGEAREISLGAIVSNKGGRDQTNTVLNIDITGPGTSFNGATTPQNLMACGGSDTLWVPTTGWVPDAIGEYTIDFEVENSPAVDATLADNAGQMTIELSENIFARDFGVFTGGGYGAFEDANSAPEVVIVGNIFDIQGDNASATGVQFALEDRTKAGTLIKPWIFELIDAADYFQGWAPVWEGPEYEIQAADITPAGNAGSAPVWLDIDIPAGDEVALTTGNNYIVGIEVPAPPDTVYIATSGDQVDFGAVLYGDLSSTADDPANIGWFQNGVNSIPMVRMKMSHVLGIETAANGNFSMSAAPNPFTDETTLKYELKEQSTVSVELIDISGKLVVSENLGSKASGQHNYQLEGSKLEAGIYYLTLTVNDQRLTQKLVHTR